jgi:hypothetical protein
MYGFFPKELIHLIALTHLASPLFLPVFVRCLPRPTLAADHSVTRLSPRFRYYSAVRLLTGHHRATSLSLIGRLTPMHLETLPVLLRSRAVLPYRAIRKHLGAVGE